MLVGADLGACPYANSVLVRGTAETLLIDPSLSLAGTAPPTAPVLVSHAHEDHAAGLADYDASVRIREKDLAALRSREVVVEGYGLPRRAPSVPTR